MSAAEEEYLKSFHVGKTLGTGSFAKVKLVTTADKSKYALKIVDKSKLKPGDLKNLGEEAKIMQELKHPGIVQLYGTFEGTRKYYLLLELCSGGELFEVVQDKEQYTEKEARFAMLQLVDAISFCHDKGVIHRDLKPENLLYAGDATDLDKARLKIADFGLSAVAYGRRNVFDTYCGTPHYMCVDTILVMRARGGGGGS